MLRAVGLVALAVFVAGCGDSGSETGTASERPPSQTASQNDPQELSADRAATALTEVLARQCLAVAPNAMGSYKIHEQTRNTGQYTEWLESAVVPHFRLVADEGQNGHVNRTYSRPTPYGPAVVTFRIAQGGMPITDITGCFMFPEITVRDVAPFPSAPEGTFVVTYQAIPKGLAGEFPFPPPGSLEVVHWPADRPYQAIIQSLDDGSTIVHSTGYPN